MAKTKKTSPKQKNSSKLLYIVWFLGTILVSFLIFTAGYYAAKDEQKSTPQPKKEQLTSTPKSSDLNSRQKDVLKKEPTSKKESKTELKKLEVEPKKPQEVKKDQNLTLETDKIEAKKIYEDATHEIDTTTPIEPIKREKSTLSSKPRLAIIIDDVSTAKQVEAIKKVGIISTMSFLPPSNSRPNSHTHAKSEPFYMVHLPMEALNYNGEEPHTLRVGDSKEQISKRLDAIVELFPSVKYINNHTGSKFTSNEKAVSSLIAELDKRGIKFVDSRTIASSKVPQVMKKLGRAYVARDVFLDHEQSKEYVKKQIKEAIRVAKDHGSAIAIGHPHKNTLEALRESKKLLESVELVRIDEMF
jgi:polysaccharide deacetylase 2 family uncharacterized protein YibQ